MRDERSVLAAKGYFQWRVLPELSALASAPFSS